MYDMKVVWRWVLGCLVGFAALVVVTLPSRGAVQSFTNSAPISITDCPNPCPASGQSATLYPSPIVVSGVSGVVERVSVVLNGYSHAFPADTDFLLVSPSGRKAILMSDTGAGAPGVASVSVTFDDYAPRPIPSTVTGNTGNPFVSGTYRPANSGITDLFPAPAPPGPYFYTLSAFNGDAPNGTWNLYVIDDANLDGGSISAGWTISFDVRPTPPAPGDLLISEFRTRGTGTQSVGTADEFIELYNNTDAPITLIDSVRGADPTSAAGAGWTLSVVNGATSFGTYLLSQTLGTAGPIAIAARGYLLIAAQPMTPSAPGNTYSLASYPTGTGFTASGVPNIPLDPADPATGIFPDNAGIALLSSAGAATSQRFDAVGFSSVSSEQHREGAGIALPGGIVTPSNHSWVRRALPATGYPRDTGDNEADFVLVDTTGAVLSGRSAVLGAPGPQRGNTATAFTTTAAPLHVLANTLTSSVVDVEQPYDVAPNFVRDTTPVNPGDAGTIKIRRRYTNATGRPLIALRFRVIDISTLTGEAVPPGNADLRLLSAPEQSIPLTDGSPITLRALTLQTPPTQASGGGLNSSVSIGAFTTTNPLGNGDSVFVEFNLSVRVDGAYRFAVIAEGIAGDGTTGASAIDTFPPPDLAITKSNGATSINASPVTYTIVASNPGQRDVISATVTDTLPAILTDAIWTCAGADGGTCAANGTGNINDVVSLPAGARVTYTLTAMLDAAASGEVTNTATVTLPDGLTDAVPEDNTSTDSDMIVVADGACGAFAEPSAERPSVELCAAGSATPVNGGALAWEWGCMGFGGGTSTGTSACSVPYGEQFISNLAVSAESLIVGGSGATVSASSTGSANAVTFATSTPEICTVADNTVTGTAAGTCVITASKAALTEGDSRYSAAAQQTVSIAVQTAQAEVPSDEDPGQDQGDRDDDDGDGCNCRSNPSSSFTWLALLVVVGWRRMRRSRCSVSM